MADPKTTSTFAGAAKCLLLGPLLAPACAAETIVRRLAEGDPKPSTSKRARKDALAKKPVAAGGAAPTTEPPGHAIAKTGPKPPAKKPTPPPSAKTTPTNYDGWVKAPASLAEIGKGNNVGYGHGGDVVKTIQRLVGVENVDGKFGAQTKNAVMAFQRKHGLKADGIVGPATLKALNKVASEPGRPSLEAASV